MFKFLLSLLKGEIKMQLEAKMYPNLVNGEWVGSRNNETITIYSPIDGSVVGNIPALSKDEVNSIIAVANESQSAWANVPVYEKAKILYDCAALLEKRVDEYAEILMWEVAKDKKSAISEINRTADFIRFSADVAKNMEGIAVNGESFPGGSKNKISYVKRVPLGTVLAISPFNYPVNLSASKIAPALMGGNTVVLKPATQGSISALLLAKAFQDAGLPNGVLNTITGRGSVIGDYVVQHTGIDFVNFTGSTEVGQHISKLVEMKPLMMELGGKDAAIVLKDADLDFAVNNIVDGAFSYSGQRCTAVKRVLVEDETADRLLPLLKAKIESLKVGMPQDNAVIVPLINYDALENAKRLIDDALEKGATLVMGNKVEGNILYPTLLDNVDRTMDVAWIEPFAPILPIIRVKDIDEAIALANASEYGLQSAVFTNDINNAFYVADRLEVGTVQINNKTERGPDHFPFLGVKASGMGTQGVKYSMEAMTRLKAVTIHLLHQD